MSDMPFDTWTEFGVWVFEPSLHIVLILVAALAVRWLVNRAIASMERTAMRRVDKGQRDRHLDKVLVAASGTDLERRRQRALTLGSLLRSVAAFVIALIAILTIMAELGLPLAPLLASAGVGGVALGFGAQSLVKDFLSGVFMIIEDQYGVGDVIDTGEAIGTVEEVTLRVTRLRDATGIVWFIRNGEIIRIGNKSQGWAAAYIDVPVSYDEQPERVIPILQGVLNEVYADEELAPKLTEEPTVAGVESVSGGVMTLRIIAKCRPGEQFEMARVVRRRCKDALDDAGVKGPQIAPLGTTPQ
ncbi:MAG: mechanosensitive ion channel domain-containing protein [Ornithinimicrobium sp.]